MENNNFNPTPTPAPEPTPAQPPVQPQFTQPTPVQPISTPTPAPTPAPEPVKKKKKWPIVVSVIVALVVIAGAAVAVALALRKPSPEQVVSEAVEKLFSDNAPTKISVDGSVAFSPNYVVSEGEISSINLAVKSKIDLTSYSEATDAVITINSSTDSKEIDLSLATFQNGSIYLKLTGINEYLTAFGMPVDIDGKWLSISLEEAQSIFSALSGDTDSSDALSTCLSVATSDLKNKRSDFLSLYQSNTFISVADESQISIAKKQDPIYEIGINSNALANFTNQTLNSNLFDDFYACFGVQKSAVAASEISASDFDSVLSIFNNSAYLEINDARDITRVYLTGTADDTNITADFSLSYPESLSIAKPSEAQSLVDIITTLLYN